MENYGLTTQRNAALRCIPIKVSGIYRFRNTLDGKIYIGSAGDIRRRLRYHLIDLRKNDHINPHLQRAFNRDGEAAFVFDVLLLCDKGELLAREQEFLDRFKSYDDKIGYNISPRANSGPSVEWTDEMRAATSKRFKGVPKSEEHRRKIGEAQKIRTVSPEMRERISKKLKEFFSDPANREAQSKRQTGIKRNVPAFSNERKKAISDANWRRGKKLLEYRKYKNPQIRSWIKLYEKGISYKEISARFNINPTQISFIIKRYIEENNERKPLRKNRKNILKPHLRKYTHEQIESWIKMKESGMTWWKIASETKVHHNNIQFQIKRYLKEKADAHPANIAHECPHVSLPDRRYGDG